MGSGRTELARALFGIDRLDSGELLVRGQPVRCPDRMRPSPRALPSSRRIVASRAWSSTTRCGTTCSCRSSAGSARGRSWTRRPGEPSSKDLIERFAVKVAHPGRPVRLLSGGNQQKVVLAKWLGTDPDVLILDEPTAGVDIGTKSEILDMIRALADAGKAVIVISSEYPELLAVSDRILVLRDGSVARELRRSEVADEESLQLAVQGV